MRIPREAFGDPEVRLRKLLERYGADTEDRPIILTTLYGQYEGQAPSGYVLELQGSPSRATVLIHECGGDGQTIVAVVGDRVKQIKGPWREFAVFEYLLKVLGTFHEGSGLSMAIARYKRVIEARNWLERSHKPKP